MTDYLLRVYVRFDKPIDWSRCSRYSEYVRRAMDMVGIDTYPDDIELGEYTIVLVYKGRHAYRLAMQLSKHSWCVRKIRLGSAYICCDRYGDLFWMLDIFELSKPQIIDIRRRYRGRRARS